MLLERKEEVVKRGRVDVGTREDRAHHQLRSRNIIHEFDRLAPILVVVYASTDYIYPWNMWYICRKTAHTTILLCP